MSTADAVASSSARRKRDSSSMPWVSVPKLVAMDGRPAIVSIQPPQSQGASTP